MVEKLIRSLHVLCLDFYFAHVTYHFVCRKPPRRKQLVKSTNKRPLKKQKQPGEGSSRGQEEPEAAQRHVHLPKTKQESFVNYQTKLIGVVLYFDDAVLSKFGLLSRVNQLLLHPDWRRLFSIRECTYAPVTYEVIQFQAFGKQHQLSINDLAVHMGFYTHQETRAATFHELLDSHTSFSVQEFWSEVTDSGSPYQGSVSSHKEFSEPEHMVVHHVMSHSFTGRMGAATVVNTTDILCLYSMTKGPRIHMGVVIAKLFQAHTSPKVSGIYLGPYLSCLLRGMGYGANLDNETNLAKMEPLHGVRLRKLKFKKVRDSSGEEEDAGEQPRPESPPPQWNPGFELDINARLDAMENDLKEHVTQRLEPVRERLATIEGQWQAFSAQYSHPSGAPPQDPQ
nr:putative retrotransposon Orf1 [Ipomoea batatas]